MFNVGATNLVTSVALSALLAPLPGSAQPRSDYPNRPVRITDRLQKEIAARLLAPETRESPSKQGAEPVASTPDQFAVFIKAEMAKWSAVIKAAGLEASQ